MKDAQPVPPDIFLLLGRIPDEVIAAEFGLPLDLVRREREAIGIKPFKGSYVDPMTFCREWQASESLRDICFRLKIAPMNAYQRAIYMRKRGIKLKVFASDRAEFWNLIRETINGEEIGSVDDGEAGEAGNDLRQTAGEGNGDQHQRGRPKAQGTGDPAVPAAGNVSQMDEGRTGETRAGPRRRGRPRTRSQGKSGENGKA